MLSRALLLALLSPALNASPSSPNASLVLLTDTDASAVSLDGSPGAIYVKHGLEPRKWLLLQRGGGWCTSDVECAERALTPLGSTKTCPPSLNFDVPDAKSEFELWPMLSSDPVYNPQFYNW